MDSIGELDGVRRLKHLMKICQLSAGAESCDDDVKNVD